MLDAVLDVIMDILREIVVEFFAHMVFYPTGWLFLKLVTLGRWSPTSPRFSNKPETAWVVGLGLAIWLVALMAALGQFVL